MKKICIFTFLLILTVILTSCAPSNPKNAENKLTKEGYIVTVDTTAIPALIHAICGTKCKVVCGNNYSNNGCIYAFYFNSKEDAISSLDYVTEWANNKIEDAEVSIDGKLIYFGNKQGLKDFK